MAADDILGFKKNVFVDIVKWGAIAGLVAGAIVFVGGLLTSLLSYSGLLGFAAGIFSFFGLISDLFWGALWGAVTVILVAKFYDKFPFKTFFMKIFGVRLVIDVVFSLLFGGLVLIFAGPLAFVIWVATVIVADFVFAKIAAAKVAPLVRLK